MTPPERTVTAGDLRRLLPPFAAAVPVAIFCVVVLALPLATAREIGLTPRQTSTWLLALYGIPGAVSLALTAAYRQPLLVAWHTAVVAFLAAAARDIPYHELLGGLVVAGLAIAALGTLGLTRRVAALVPAPVVFGVVAATVLPFVVGTFDALGEEPVVVGVALIVYLLSRQRPGGKLPPVLLALVGGIVAAALTGDVEPLPEGWSALTFEAARPVLSVRSIASVVPVVVVLVAMQANLTAVIYLRSHEFQPPGRAIDIATGLATTLGVVFGPVPVCMAALMTPLTAGPEAGEREVRHWSVYASGLVLVLIGLGSGVAAAIPSMIPLPLLLAVAGLALLGVLGHALGEITRGPLRLGPLVAFAVASSDLSLLDLGPPFWALVVGTGAAIVLEGDVIRNPQGGRCT